MSYPPAVHILRDLGITGTREADRAVNRIAIEPGLTSPGSGVRLGVMATLLDVTGAAVALMAVRPDWIATADLSVHLIRTVTEGSIEVECRPLRVGAGTVIVDAALRDQHGTICGTGRMAFARIPGSATTASIDRVGPAPTEFAIDGGTPMSGSILERCGMESVGPGQLRFENAEYVRNSFGTINGGVLALAAEAAAVSASGEGAARDVQIRYLEQIGTGPVAVTAEVVRSDDHGRLCAVRIEDRADGRLAAVSDVYVCQ